jgi:hypothetical protein
MKWYHKLLKRFYVLNRRTGETHDFRTMTKRCGKMNPENMKFISYRKFKKLKGTPYNSKVVNGCKWCLEKYDLG